MAKKRLSLTTTDYIVQALSPLLIMALIGSLVFFLLEVLYQGAYSGNLKWMLFFYVFGAVLVARISMRQDIAHRSSLYGLALGLAVWLGMMRFLDYKTGEWDWAINLGLIWLVWWCAKRLTWDCTFLDEDGDSNGQGILQATGLEATAPDEEEIEEEGEKLGWWDRYQKYRAEQRSRRAPGAQVIYFSLAALPVFGLGQSLIPVGETERRQYVLWLTVIYVAAGLGLLLTTSLLGLRHYLRLRKVRMPASMAGTWIASGSIIILLLVFAAIVLPRPRGEYQLIRLPGTGSEELEASRWSPHEMGEGKDEPGAKDVPRDSKDGQSSSQKDSKTGKDRKSEPGKKDPGKKDQGGKDNQQSGGKDGKDTSQPKDKKGKDQAKDRSPQKDDQKNGNRKDNRFEKDASKRKDGEPGKEQPQEPPDEEESERETSSGRSIWQKVGGILKWVVFGILALLVLFFVLRNFLQFLANFSEWARNLLEAWRRFWAVLFSTREKEADEEDLVDWTESVTAPFSAFSNPFADGRAESMSVRELARYTFAALQAWAREKGIERSPGETPLEMVERLGEEIPSLEKMARKMATLYSWSEYGKSRISESARGLIEELWAALEKAEHQPLSA